MYMLPLQSEPSIADTQKEESTAEGTLDAEEMMMDAAAANWQADATFAQLMTWWPWPSFKNESLETAFQAMLALAAICLSCGVVY